LDQQICPIDEHPRDANRLPGLARDNALSPASLFTPAGRRAESQGRLRSAAEALGD
jgi:hypothetical protein